MSTLFAIIVLIFSVYGMIEFLRKVRMKFKKSMKGVKENAGKSKGLPQDYSG